MVECGLYHADFIAFAALLTSGGGTTKSNSARNYQFRPTPLLLSKGPLVAISLELRYNKNATLLILEEQMVMRRLIGMADRLFILLVVLLAPDLFLKGTAEENVVWSS